MIEANLHQGVIQLSETTRNDEFLPAHTAEATLKKRVRRDKIINAALFSFGAADLLIGEVLLANGLTHGTFLNTLFGSRYVYGKERFIDMGIGGFDMASGAFLVGLSTYETKNEATNKLKLAKTQHLLGTTPHR